MLILLLKSFLSQINNMLPQMDHTKFIFLLSCRRQRYRYLDVNGKKSACLWYGNVVWLLLHFSITNPLYMHYTPTSLTFLPYLILVFSHLFSLRSKNKSSLERKNNNRLGILLLFFSLFCRFHCYCFDHFYWTYGEKGIVIILPVKHNNL